MGSVTGEPVHGSRTCAGGAQPGGGTAAGACRWCEQPSAWVWSLGGAPAAELDGWAARDEVRVCPACQALTLAGDDAGVLDRFGAMLAARTTYPVAVEFLREQRAAWLAHWVLRRTTVRAAGPRAAEVVR